MGYIEDGEELENLSGFTGSGFDSMPNFYEDNKNIGSISTLGDAALQHMYETYTAWAARKDIMPRAKQAAERILNHLEFEFRYQAGVYEVE